MPHLRIAFLLAGMLLSLLRASGQAEELAADKLLDTIENRWREEALVLRKKIPDVRKLAFEVQYTLILNIIAPVKKEDRQRVLLESLKRNNDITRDLVCGMIIQAHAERDREALINIIAKECPRETYPHHEIEYFLAYFFQDEIIDIFAESYQKADSENKKRIAAAVRRMMHSIDIRAEDDQGFKTKSDEEFIKKSIEWYNETKKKSKVIINERYGENYYSITAFERTQPFFIIKPLPPQAGSSKWSSWLVIGGGSLGLIGLALLIGRLRKRIFGSPAST